MKKGLTIVALLLFLTSCKDAKETFVLSSSVGKSNQLLVVTEASDWNGKVGDNLSPPNDLWAGPQHFSQRRFFRFPVHRGSNSDAMFGANGDMGRAASIIIDEHQA